MNFAKKQVHNPEQGLVNLVNKTFDMYECSTFHGFRTERQICIKFESSLQRVLSKHLNIREITTDDKQLPSRSKIQRRIASNMRGDLQRVDVRPFPIEGWDSPYTPMEINIHIRYDETDKDEISNIIMIPSKEQPENESFSAYPLLLVRSKQVVWEVVAHWIKRTLDCHVFQLTVPVALLGQIAEWWASYLYDMPPGENERVNGNI
ncbi:hypothetical protein BDA99DRAFT_502170 [Phascolomyces articulosus]|uniref:Uncharacterized protein n=1 Tax=Phascolomyces articulosus TaxID=60185 RepID=A0AAD5KGR7_9FUNG|nr:hypothetical protein BDA99DRAFT_502170 [Phascolomyces articulosus]